MLALRWSRSAPRSDLWRHGDFLRLWAAQTVSEFGSRITLVALPLAAIYVLHATAFEVAVLSTIEYVPFLLFSLPAGVWVDRMPRRPVMVAADLGRAVVLASIPIVYAFGALTLLQLYAVGFVAGTLTVFFQLSNAAYLPSLLQRDHLVEANAKLQVTESLAEIGGPATAGGLVSLVSAPTAIGADSASFLASGLVILSIRKPEREEHRRASQEDEGSLWSRLKRGGRFTLGHSYVRPVVLSSVVANFGFNWIWGILFVFAVRTLGLHAALIGALLALGEVGGLLGATVGNRLARAAGIGPTMIVAAVVSAPAVLAVALTPRAMPIPLFAIGWMVGSFTRVVFNVIGTSIRQAVVPQHLQGRVVGFNRFIAWGVIPLGSLSGGAVATNIGLRAAMIVGAIIASCWAVPVLFSPLRSLQELPATADGGGEPKDSLRRAKPAT